MHELRIFAAADHLQVELAAQWPAEREHAFIARLGDLAAAVERHVLEGAARLEDGERSDLAQAVIGALDTELPVVLAAFPVIFGAGDGFAGA